MPVGSTHPERLGLAPAARTPELAHLRGVGTVRRRGSFLLRQVKRPELLPAVARRELMEMIARESGVMFDGADTALYWDRRPDYFSEISDWWVAERDGRLVGWCAFDRWDSAAIPVLYIDTLGIMPGDRRSGIGTLIVVEAWMRLCLSRRRSAMMSMRIQTPVVLRMVLRCAAPWTHPRPGYRRRRRTDAAALAVAARTAARTSPGCRFEPETFVVRGAFGRRLYGRAVPRTGDARVDSWFDRNLDDDAGDALIAVMALTPGTLVVGFFVWAAMRASVFLRGRRQR